MKTIRCAVYTRKSNEEGLELAKPVSTTSRAKSTRDGKQLRRSTAMVGSPAAP